MEQLSSSAPSAIGFEDPAGTPNNGSAILCPGAQAETPLPAGRSVPTPGFGALGSSPSPRKNTPKKAGRPLFEKPAVGSRRLPQDQRSWIGRRTKGVPQPTPCVGVALRDSATQSSVSEDHAPQPLVPILPSTTAD